ncbi:MAG: hypothetical protein ACOZF0_15545 [Thermodesulfobacteriota bacterium]
MPVERHPAFHPNFDKRELYVGLQNHKTGIHYNFDTISTMAAAVAAVDWSRLQKTSMAVERKEDYYEQAMNNQFICRIKNRTPIEGLYLASAWGYPGGGYEGVMRSGLETFRMIVESV